MSLPETERLVFHQIKTFSTFSKTSGISCKTRDAAGFAKCFWTVCCSETYFFYMLTRPLLAKSLSHFLPLSKRLYNTFRRHQGKARQDGEAKKAAHCKNNTWILVSSGKHTPFEEFSCERCLLTMPTNNFATLHFQIQWGKLRSCIFLWQFE